MIYNLLYRRHMGHIELDKVLIMKGLYIILCVLCAYVLKKNQPTFVGREVRPCFYLLVTK